MLQQLDRRALGGRQGRDIGLGQGLQVDQLVEVLEQQHAHEIDRREVGIQPHPPAAVQPRHRHPDRQAAREHPAIPGGEDTVAGLDRVLAAHIGQFGVRAAVARQYGPGVGAVDQDRRAAGDIGQEQDPAGAVGDAHHPADHPVLAHHRIANHHAPLRADVGQPGIGEGAARIHHHMARDHVDRRIGLEVEQGAQPLILVAQGDGGVAIAFQLEILLTKLLVLADGEEIFPHRADTAAGPADRRGDGPAHRHGDAGDHVLGGAVGFGLQGLAAVADQDGHSDDASHDHGHARCPDQRRLDID